MEMDLQSPAPANGSGGFIIDGNTEDFAVNVVQASMEGPVLVDFWADWCGPCKQLTPILEKVVTQAAGAIKLVKINADQNQQLAQQLRIQSLPTVMAFKNGQAVDGFMGALPESEVKKFIEKHIGGGVAPSPVEQMLEQAAATLEAGDAEMASQMYQQILQAEDTNPEAFAGLIRALVALGDLESAQQVSEAAPEDAKSAELDSARAALELALQAADAGDTGELEAAITANPKDHQARFDLSAALMAKGDQEGAMTQLLESIAIDRTWNDEAARKQLLTLFEAFGPTHELTLSGRRRLSSILFS